MEESNTNNIAKLVEAGVLPAEPKDTVLPVDGLLAGIIKQIEDNIGAGEVFELITKLEGVVERQKEQASPNQANILFYTKILNLIKEVPVRREQADGLKATISTQQFVIQTQREQILMLEGAAREYTTLQELYYDKSIEVFERIRNARNIKKLQDLSAK